MAFCVLNGETISCRLNEQQGQPVGQGEIIRMFSNRARSTRRGGIAEEWSLITTPELPASASVIEALTARPGSVEAYGDLFGRDSSAPIDVYVTPGTVRPRKYMDGERRIVEFRVQEVHPLETPLRYVPGFGNLTHSRADASLIATYTDDDGRIQAVTANGELRDDHYTADGGRATLLELSRENLLLRSEAFDNAAWTKARVSITADQHTAPDGTTTADRLVEDGTASATHSVAQLAPSGLTADATHAYSVFAKDVGGGRNWILVRIHERGGGGFSNRASAYFNVATGAVGTTASAGTGTFVDAYTEDAGDGWYRCVLIASIGNSATDATSYVYLANADSGDSYSGDGSSYLAIWGAQFEDDSEFATSYIATTTDTVSRAVDIASHVMPAAIVSPSTPWTWYGRWVAGMDDDGGESVPQILHIGDSFSSGNLYVDWNTGAGDDILRFRHDNGTTSDSDTMSGLSISRGDTCEAIVKWNGDGSGTLYLWVNGTFIDSATLSGITPASAWNPDGSGNVNVYYNSRNGGNNAGAMSLRDSKFAYRGGRVPIQASTNAQLLAMMRGL